MHAYFLQSQIEKTVANGTHTTVDGYSWKPNTNNTNEDESCNAAPLESAMKRKTLKFALIWDLSGGLTVLASVVSG